jgi:hypothetical protein
MWEAKNLGGIEVDPREKIESLRKKVMAKLPE